MREAIENFSRQLAYVPEVVHREKLLPFFRVAVMGMGGSRWPAYLIRNEVSGFPITLHNDYGLPQIPERDDSNPLFVACSYSGDTEEVLSGFEAAIKEKLNVAVIAAGGTLIARAKELGIPYVELPDMNLQPRMATGLLVKALLAVMGKNEELEKISSLATAFNPLRYEPAGKELAMQLKNLVPVVYASRNNEALAYVWKIKFNETGKIPAFCNVVPELNHNEMTGFDRIDATKELSARFSFVFLEDEADDPRIKNRMKVLASLYEKRGLPVRAVPLEGVTVYEKMFGSLVLADWTAYALAEMYGTEPEQVPMVEEFKKLIK